MTSLAATMNEGEHLLFARSASKTVGVSGPLVGLLRANAPRVVGGLKILAGLSLGFADPILIGFAVFFAIAQIIPMAYGTKANQEKTAREMNGAAPDKETGIIAKVFNPRAYPVESSAGFAVVSQLFGVAYGGKLLAQQAWGGLAPLGIALLSIASYVNILLGQEKKDPQGKNTADEQKAPLDKEPDALVFSQSESKPVGMTGRLMKFMKNNPVLTSSVGLMAACVVGIVVGLLSPEIKAGYVVGLGISPEEVESLLKAMDEDVGIRVLVTGTLENGEPHYAYASIPPSRYMAFKEAESAGNYDLAAFGKILAHGKGHEPPQEVQQRMAEEHGANHRFEEEFNAWLEEFNRAVSSS